MEVVKNAVRELVSIAREYAKDAAEFSACITLKRKKCGVKVL